MKPQRFRIELLIQAPILIKSSSPAAFGVDAAMDTVPYGPNQGTPRIPGTALRGHLAESLEQLYPGNTRANSWLGRWVGWDPDRKSDPVRGALIIEDLISSTRKDATADRTRIKIDDTMGSVEKGMMQVVEMPWPAGCPVTFVGIVWLYESKTDDLPGGDSLQVLQSGLSWLTQLGANKTIGFGRILKATVTREPPEDDSLANAESLDVVLRPRQPLCVARPGSMGNLFVSEDFIPGNMLAGAIMETAKYLGLDADLRKAGFDLIRFRYSFPATTVGKRAACVPYSWTTGGDMIDQPLAQTVHGDAPAFAMDWKGKDWGRYEKALGIVQPARELRVRTKIDSVKRTADRGKGTEEDGGKLFAWEMVHPCLDDEKATPCVWNSRIDLTGLDKEAREPMANLLRTVLSSLAFVSKTKAICPASIQMGAPDSHTIRGNTLCIDLVTPALLIDPRWQRGLSGHISAEVMRDLYKEVWFGLSGKSLELTHFFARQHLSGGEQAFHTFQKDKPYNPWLLTSAGSVFVFNVKDPDKAQDKLNEWLTRGLDLPGWTTGDNVGTMWKQNPFLRQNGFGEIAIHDASAYPHETPHQESP